MISLQKFTGPFGIPVYHQQMPDIVQSVSMAWVVFTGSADDESIGLPGLYHWFEHVPFRGTRKYPNGYKDIKGRFTKHGGQIGAWTRPEATAFHAHIPKKAWREALSVITDLWAQPLLTDEGIEAERKIIAQEIQQKLGSSGSKAYYQLSSLLWPGHHLGHPVIGDEESLRTMKPETLRKAHSVGYDRSRCALVVIGNISTDEILKELESLSQILPDNSLTERHAPVGHGALPAWQNGKTDIVETEFASSMVMMLFPIDSPVENRKRELLHNATICGLFTFGGTSSPLYKILREERNLVYSVQAQYSLYSDGGYMGFVTEAKKENVDAIVEAFKTALMDKTVRSAERLREIQEGIASGIDMQPIDTLKYRDTFIQRFLQSGGAVSDDEYKSALAAVTIRDVEDWMRDLTPDNARTIVFKGMGK